MNKNNDFLSALDEEQIDEVLKYSSYYSDMSLENIKKGVKHKLLENGVPDEPEKSIKRKKKYSRRFLAIAALIGLLATGIVYAGIMKPDGIYKALFGEKSDYMLNRSEPLDNIALADGMRLSLLSAYKDQGSIVLFFTLTDEEGDRLSDYNVLFYDFNYDFSSGTSDTIHYDKETKTATCYIMADFSVNETIGEDITLTLYNLDATFGRIEYYQKGINLYRIMKDHTAGIKKTTFYDMYDAFHLKESQLHIPLEGVGDWAYFSNAGFVDGALHLQVANSEMTETVFEKSFIRGQIMTLYLIDKNGNKIGDAATGRLPDETDEIRVLSFYGENEKGPWTFREFIFPEISDIEELRGMTVVAEGHSYDNVRAWQTTFTLPEDESNVTIPANKEMMLGKRKVNAHKITLSPFCVRVYYEGFYLTYEGSYGGFYSAFSDDELPGQTFPKDEVFITYKDGTKVILAWAGVETDTTARTTSKGLAAEKFSLPYSVPMGLIEVEKVKSVTIYEQEFLL